MQARIDLKGVQALVVDDNAQSLELLSQILIGFRMNKIKSARSAGEADQTLRAHKFDLLIIDSEMPGEDGLSLTRRIRREARSENATASIILISAHTSAEKVALARDCGANLVVKKPIVPAILLSRIVWLASTTRQFVNSETYCGPDRRFRIAPPPDGRERRVDANALIADPERAMSQNEVDSLFG